MVFQAVSAWLFARKQTPKHYSDIWVSICCVSSFSTVLVQILVLCCILCLSPNTTIVVLWIYVYLYVDYYCACALESSILNNWVNVGHCGVSVSKLHTSQPLKGEWDIKSCWVLVRSQYIVVGSLWWHIVGTSLAGSSIVCHVSLTF